MHLFEVYVKVNADKEEETASGASPTMDEARAIFKAMRGEIRGAPGGYHAAQ